MGRAPEITHRDEPLRHQVLALAGTVNAPVSAYQMSDGVLLATLALTDSGRTYGTVNTPGANGDRLYVSTQLLAADGSADPSAQGRLYAIDVNAGEADPGNQRQVLATHGSPTRW